jgi:hypothetical protein
MTVLRNEQEHHSSPSYLRFTPSDAFQQDLLAPLLTPEAIRHHHRISAGLLLSSTAIRVSRDIPHDLALATLHKNARHQFKDRSRLHATSADYAPLLHSEIDERTGNLRNMVHGFDVQFRLNHEDGERLSAVIPHDAESEEEDQYYADDLRSLHFVVGPRELAFTPRETMSRLEEHVSDINHKLGRHSLRSIYYISNEPNVIARRTPR